MARTYTIPSGTSDGATLIIDDLTIARGALIAGRLSAGTSGLAGVDVIGVADQAITLSIRTVVAGADTTADATFRYDARTEQPLAPPPLPTAQQWTDGSGGTITPSPDLLWTFVGGGATAGFYQVAGFVQLTTPTDDRQITLRLQLGDDEVFDETTVTVPGGGSVRVLLWGLIDTDGTQNIRLTGLTSADDVSATTTPPGMSGDGAASHAARLFFMQIGPHSDDDA